MMKGFSVPLTPSGRASMVPNPPWYYVGNVLRVEYLAEPGAVGAYLPQSMAPAEDGHCTLYFIEWQTASVDFPEKYVEPIISQYRETLLIIHAQYKGEAVGLCPFIWVDNETAILRGHLYGFPKQLGFIHITRAYNIESLAGPVVGKGGKFGATASAKDARLFDAMIELEEPCSESALFPKMYNVRHFPNLSKAQGYKPAINDLVMGVSHSAKTANHWKGKAQMKVYDDCYPDLAAFQPVKVLAGYYHTQAHCTDDMEVIEDFR